MTYENPAFAVLNVAAPPDCATSNFKDGWYAAIEHIRRELLHMQDRELIRSCAEKGVLT